jgi:acetyl esterase
MSSPGPEASLLPAREAALLPDVAADLFGKGVFVEAVQPWAPLWLRRIAYDGAGRVDAARLARSGALPCALVETEHALAPAGGGGAPLPARLYAPRLAHLRGEATPVIVYVHGGGFALGSLASHAATCAALAAETGWRVLAVTYRRAPEARWPAAALDALAAYDAVAAAPAQFGADARAPQLVLAGDSAGGQIVVEVALRLRDRARAAAGGRGGARAAPAAAPAPALLVPIYPAVNFFSERPSKARFASGYGILTRADCRAYAAGYLGETAEVRAQLADDAYLNADLQRDFSGMPPMLVVTAEFDPLHDEGVALVAAARARGAGSVEHVEAAGRLHGCVQQLMSVPSNLAFVRTLAARMVAQLAAAAK